jgi:hypothetical protein
MSKILMSIAALGLIGAASLPLPAAAAERHDGVSNAQQSTDVSAQRRWRRHYGYYGYPYYPYRYGYYRPGFGVGIGPFGFRVF